MKVKITYMISTNILLLLFHFGLIWPSSKHLPRPQHDFQQKRISRFFISKYVFVVVLQLPQYSTVVKRLISFCSCSELQYMKTSEHHTDRSVYMFGREVDSTEDELTV